MPHRHSYDKSLNQTEHSTLSGLLPVDDQQSAPEIGRP